MDYGDIIRLIVFGFIFLSFFSGLFGGKKKDEEGKPKQQKPKPVRPTELSESGGPARSRPVVMAEPAGSIEVYTGEGVSRTEARREELRERFGGELAERRREQRRREPLERDVHNAEQVLLERDVRNAEQALLERDLTDVATIAEELDPERRPRRQPQPQAQRRRRYVEGGDVLRRSLKDPATLERAFIVKEVLDRPLSLRDGR
jgi:hypothetical protein